MLKKEALLGFFVVLLGALLSTGCMASFRGHKVPEVKSFPPAPRASVPADKPCVCIAATWDWKLGGLDGPRHDYGESQPSVYALTINTYWRGVLTKQAERLAEDSDIFAAVSSCGTSKPEGCLKIQLVALEGQADYGLCPRHSYMYLVCWPFLGVAPAAFPLNKDIFRLTATVSDSAGNELRVCQYEDSVADWCGLVLFPLTFSKNPNNVRTAMIQNMLKQLYCDLAEDELLYPRGQ